MPSGDYASKERQSVYEKALVICHEGEKELSLLQQELDRSKLQKYISYKLEERELQKELFRIKQEQRTLALEAKRREREHMSIDDLAKEIKLTNPGNMAATAIMLEKKFALPQINCTQNNVPRILQRSLSHESEYFTWTFGLPKIENAVKALNTDVDQKKKDKEKPAKENDAFNEFIPRRRTSTVRNIVYNVPVDTERRDSSALPTKLPPINISRENRTPGQGLRDRLNSVSGNKAGQLELPKI